MRFGYMNFALSLNFQWALYKTKSLAVYLVDSLIFLLSLTPALIDSSLLSRDPIGHFQTYHIIPIYFAFIGKLLELQLIALGN